jgi:hypothetical protein
MAALKNPEMQCLQFKDKDGKSLEGHNIRFQLVCVYAPESRTQLSVLAGTWNVGAPPPSAGPAPRLALAWRARLTRSVSPGNARPEGDLAAWLEPQKDMFRPDFVMVGPQETTVT